MLTFMMFEEFGFHKLFFIEFCFLTNLLQTELGIGAADDDGFGEVFGMFMGLRLRMIGDFNDGRFVIGR